MVIAMSLYMMIVEYLSIEDNVESVKNFFDKTNSGKMLISKSIVSAIESKKVAAAGTVGLLGAMSQAVEVVTLWIKFINKNHYNIHFYKVCL